MSWNRNRWSWRWVTENQWPGQMGLRTTGNIQAGGNYGGRSTPLVTMGKLRNTSGSLTRKYKYCAATAGGSGGGLHSLSINALSPCIFDYTVPSASIATTSGGGGGSVTLYTITIVCTDGTILTSVDSGATWTVDQDSFGSGSGFTNQFYAQSLAISNITGKQLIIAQTDNGGGNMVQPEMFTRTTSEGMWNSEDSFNNSDSVDYEPFGLCNSSVYISGDASVMGMTMYQYYNVAESPPSSVFESNVLTGWSGISYFISSMQDAAEILSSPLSISMSDTGQVQLVVCYLSPSVSRGYISLDSGNLWNPASLPEFPAYSVSAGWVSGSGELIVIGTLNPPTPTKIYYSNNQGNSWFQGTINLVGMADNFGQIAGSADGSVLVMINNYQAPTISTNGYLYLSTDFGHTWSVPTALMLQYLLWSSISVNRDGSLIVAVASDGLSYSLYTSVDQGTTWTITDSTTLVGGGGNAYSFECIICGPVV